MTTIQKQKGFSLIELLVTVTILGILSALSISMFQEYKAKAYDMTGKTIARSLLVVGEAYLADWDGNSGAHHWVIRDADGSYRHVNDGMALVEYFPPEASMENMTLYIGVNTFTLMGPKDWSNPSMSDDMWLTFSRAGHCESMPGTANFRHHAYTTRPADLNIPLATYEASEVAKARYKCL